MSQSFVASHRSGLIGIQKILAIPAILLILGTAGCCGPSTLEMDYGNSWVYNEEVQIANPQAAWTETPATGLNPNASVNVMGAYNKGFSGKKAGDSKSTTINLGGITSGGSGGSDSGGGN